MVSADRRGAFPGFLPVACAALDAPSPLRGQCRAHTGFPIIRRRDQGHADGTSTQAAYAGSRRRLAPAGDAGWRGDDIRAARVSGSGQGWRQGGPRCFRLGRQRRHAVADDAIAAVARLR